MTTRTLLCARSLVADDNTIGPGLPIVGPIKRGDLAGDRIASKELLSAKGPAGADECAVHRPLDLG